VDCTFFDLKWRKGVQFNRKEVDMPYLKEHRIFDIILKWEGIISDETKTDKVHQFIDRRVPEHHHILDEKVTEKKVREWVNRFAHLGYPETTTDYIRVTFGHLVLDEIWDKYRKKPLITILRKSFSLFKRRGFHRKYFV